MIPQNKLRPKYGSLSQAKRHSLKRLLWKAQGEACAICQRYIKPDLTLYRDVTALDHDHKTGEVRGLLCVNCNIHLGYYEKSKKLAQAFEAYLADPPIDRIDRAGFRYTPRNPLRQVSIAENDPRFIEKLIKDL